MLDNFCLQTTIAEYTGPAPGTLCQLSCRDPMRGWTAPAKHLKLSPFSMQGTSQMPRVSSATSIPDEEWSTNCRRFLIAGSWNPDSCCFRRHGATDHIWLRCSMYCPQPAMIPEGYVYVGLRVEKRFLPATCQPWRCPRVPKGAAGNLSNSSQLPPGANVASRWLSRNDCG